MGSWNNALNSLVTKMQEWTSFKIISATKLTIRKWGFYKDNIVGHITERRVTES